MPHSGGQRGGRPAVGATRGVLAGQKRNVRELGASVLRRDPTLAQKLAVIFHVEQAGRDPASMPSLARREIEKLSGYSWNTAHKTKTHQAPLSSQDKTDSRGNVSVRNILHTNKSDTTIS